MSARGRCGMPRWSGHGVEGQVAGADLGMRMSGLSCRWGRWLGWRPSARGRRGRAGSGGVRFRGCIVDGGEQDVAVVVQQDAGDSVLLVLDTACGLVERLKASSNSWSMLFVRSVC